MHHLLDQRIVAVTVLIEIINNDNSAMNPTKESLNCIIYLLKINCNQIIIVVKVNSIVLLTDVRLQAALLKIQGRLKALLLTATIYTFLNIQHFHLKYQNNKKIKMINVLIIKTYLNYLGYIPIMKP